MFLKYFDGTQKKAFLAIAHKLSQADGKVTAEEKKVLELMCEEAGFCPGDTLVNFDLERLLSPFDNRKAQVQLLLELVSMEYADRSFSRTENELMSEIADYFGISQQILLEIEGWVFKHDELLKELDKFWK
ncbi:MAG: hypothetical protein PHW04_00155 [Candidatus Wallbacteria bacterium]|nr:hypothetical protein [Candidatus Wallbacteria bacterium]